MGDELTRALRELDEYITTSPASAMAILQALSRQKFLLEFEAMAPLVRAELERNGVVFP